MQTPTFITYNNSDDVKLKLIWLAYVNQHFNPNKSANMEMPIRHALDYNLSQINKALNNPELKCWTNILLEVKDDISPATFFGGYLRQFYEKSEPSAANLILIRILLANKASVPERLDFYREINNDYKTYELFYGKSLSRVGVLLPYVIGHLQKSEPDRQRAEYFLKYVYSPAFMSQTDKYANSRMVSNINILSSKLEYLFENIFKDDSSKINFFVSSLYVLNRSLSLIENLNLQELESAYDKTDERFTPELHKKITTLFETTFPDTYKQYQLMMNLDLNLSLQEMAASLITHTDTPAQPLSTIEF